MKIIIISGPSGSGKTTLAREIKNKVKDSFVLSTDNYYKTGMVSKFLSIFIRSYFDREISFNHKLIKEDIKNILKTSKCSHTYSYNFKNKTIRKSIKKINEIKILIVEGIFANKLITNLDSHNCLFIRLENNKNTCMDRVIKRDVKTRGKSKKIAKKDFLKSWEYYYIKNKNEIPNKNEIIFIKKPDMDLLLKKIISS